MPEPLKICLIGAGNVAYHLARVFYKKGANLTQVFSRNIKNANAISKRTGAEAIDQIASINDAAEVYVIAVKDDAISSVASEIYENDLLRSKLIIHTSGFTSSGVLSAFENYGVFWPLQSFSKKDKIKFKKLPICIFGNSETSINTLELLANSISKNVHFVDDQQRAYLHIAAVFANNFTNRMFSIAKEITFENDLNFELLMPLIEKTINKIKKGDPIEMQTGPAYRNDSQVMEKQFGLLNDYPDFQVLYRIISDNIANHYHDEN